MQNFIITGQLSADKSLNLSQQTVVSQGEHLTTLLQIEIAEQYKDCNFQLQFQCPNNLSYSTPLLALQEQDGKYYITYPLENYLLQYVGNVTVQVEVRNSVDNCVLWKSNVNTNSVIQVSASTDTRQQAYARQDFFAQAYKTIDAMKQNEQDLNTLETQVQAVENRCNDFLQQYNTMLEQGKLTGPRGAEITSMIETGKDDQGDSIYTVTMSDGKSFQFVVKAGRQGEKGDKGDKGDVGPTGEYIVNVTLEQTLENGDKQYKITTNLSNSYYFVAPKGTDGETLTQLTYTSTDQEGNKTYTFVTNTGKQFNFVVPRGEKGEQGIQGEKGDTPALEGVHESLTSGKAIADQQGNNIASTYAPKNTVYRPNLVRNGNFAINQRAKSAYTTADYNVDGWYSQQATATITPQAQGGVRIAKSNATNGEVLQAQKIDKLTDGATLSISCSINNTVIKKENFTTTAEVVTADGKVKLKVYKSSDLYIVELLANTNGNIDFVCNWVKLEYGSYCTPFVAPDYMQELRRCQQYYVAYSGNGTFLGCGYSFNTTGAYIVIPLPVKMRIELPTISLNDCYLSSANHQASSSKLITETTEVYCSGNILKIAVKADGLTTGETNVATMRSSASLLTVDAEL